MAEKTKIIAFYLPQFHPIPENDEWWGKGFTEWTNVGNAKPKYLGHYQPKVPTSLGYYDLRVSETRVEQAEMAKSAGIDGFCYWHYWFGNGKRLLERPFNEVLESGKPDFPFCLGWANHSWHKKTWQPGNDGELLIEQKYLGKDDVIAHFNDMLSAFKDDRYIVIDNKPLFLIYAPLELPNPEEFMNLWNICAKEHGFDGFYFIGFSFYSRDIAIIKSLGFDAVLLDLLIEAIDNRSLVRKIYQKSIQFLLSTPRFLNYSEYRDYFLSIFEKNTDSLPCIVPNFDHTPRSGKRGILLTKSNPKKFGELLKKTIELINKYDKKKNILFIKSWNEWGEGNYLEPDIKYGSEYLEVLKELTNKN